MAKTVNPFAQYGYKESGYLVNRDEQAEIRMKVIADETISESGGMADMADILGTDADGIDYLKSIVGDKNDTTGVLVELQKKANKSDVPSIEGLVTTEEMNEALALKADKTEIPTDFYTQEDVNKLISQLTSRIENIEEKESIIVADTAEMVQNAAAGTDVVLTSTEAIQAMTATKEFNTITMVGGNSNADIKLTASDKVTVDGTTINGDKGASNGRMQVSCSDVTIKNVEIESGATAYNVFEGNQNVNAPQYFTKEYNVSNIVCDNTLLNHNVFNIYTFDNDAVVNISDSYFNLDVDKSNALRLANCSNASGVTVNFENVEWTYENAPGTDWFWAGLVIYQPYGADKMTTGDDSAFKTWKFNFKNCKYNGVKVDANNYGQHNQVFYMYNVNNSGVVSDPATVSGLSITFE